MSLGVGLLFWPRGAAAALRTALADAYIDGARYLDRSVEFGMNCCDSLTPPPSAPADEATQAAAASRRLDDAFRSYLAERGAKPLPLAEVTSLVNGATALRLTADAVLDLWQRDAHQAEGDRSAARAELIQTSGRIRSWYEELATSLAYRNDAPAPLAHDDESDARLADAVRHDLVDRDGNATATAVRVIWTGDHLAAARGMQALLREPAHTAAEAHALSMFARMRPWRPA